MPEVEPLRLIAVSRVKSRPARVLAALFLATAATLIEPSWYPAAWLVAILAMYAADGAISLRLVERIARGSRVSHTLFYVWVVANAAIYSVIAMYFWRFGGPFGEAVAIIQSCAGMIQVAIQLRAVRSLMIASLASHGWVFLLVPCVAGVTQYGPSGIILPIVGVAVFAGLLYQLVRHSAREQVALIKATRAAEAERTFTLSVIENIPNLVSVLDVRSGRYELINRAIERLTGFSREDAIGKSYEEFYPPADAQRLRELDAEAIATGRPVLYEDHHVRTADGAKRVLRGRRVSVPGEDGQPRFIIAVGEDVTDILEAEAQVVKLAHYDSLTDLPNRVLFRRELNDAFEAAVAGQSRAALLWIDLDHFKEVNDTLGHLVGDQLLMDVAERLKATIRSQDTVARLGGDEFAIVQTDIVQNSDAEDLARRVVATLCQPFHLSGRAISIGASIGVAFAPDDGATADELMMHADMALYRCKQTGRGGHRLFEREMNERRRARRTLEQDLRRAFQDDAFTIAYQPQLDVASGRIAGCEALMRLQLDGRSISPAEFIPVAEDIGLINQMGEWILRQACAEAANWPGAMKVAINISPAQFKDQNLIRTIISSLAHAGLSPDRLELEITESTLLHGNQANLTTLFRLRELGVSVALDDFGTGFSSLNYLRQFPFTKIKIDKSFVSDLSMSLESVSIVKAITGMATSLGMNTTAEGVETERQFEMVRGYGCTQIQGFLISPPCSPAELRAVFERFGSDEASQTNAGDAELWLATG